MAICEDDGADFITSAKLFGHRHAFFDASKSRTRLQAMKLAKRASNKVAFDIDLDRIYGRLVDMEMVKNGYQKVLLFEPWHNSADLIIGTEELAIAGGQLDTLDALRETHTFGCYLCLQKRTAAVWSLKMKSKAGDGVSVPCKPSKSSSAWCGWWVYVRLLRGWLRDEPLERCAAYANGCRLASRVMFAPAYPSFEELLIYWLSSSHHALRLDHKLEQLHWSTTRKKRYDELIALHLTTAYNLRRWPKKQGAMTTLFRPLNI